MFAIHYFFESEKAIKTFLHNVSINLKEGDHHQAAGQQQTVHVRTNVMFLRPAVAFFTNREPNIIFAASASAETLGYFLRSFI